MIGDIKTTSNPYTITNLSMGTHTVIIYLVDYAGNVSRSIQKQCSTKIEYIYREYIDLGDDGPGKVVDVLKYNRSVVADRAECGEMRKLDRFYYDNKYGCVVALSSEVLDMNSIQDGCVVVYTGWQKYGYACTWVRNSEKYRLQPYSCFLLD